MTENARAWWEEDFVVYDLETTGVDTNTAKIVQVAAVLFSGGTVARRSSALINPGEPIPDGATAIHGITDEMVKDRPTIQELAPRLIKAMEQAPVMFGYNNLRYDDEILSRELGNAWVDCMIAHTRLDVFPLIKLKEVGKFWKGKKTLTASCERLGVKVSEDAHTASADCVMTGEMMMALLFDEKFGPAVKEILGSDGAQASKRLLEISEEQEREYRAYLNSKRNRR